MIKFESAIDWNRLVNEQEIKPTKTIENHKISSAKKEFENNIIELYWDHLNDEDQ